MRPTGVVIFQCPCGTLATSRFRNSASVAAGWSATSFGRRVESIFRAGAPANVSALAAVLLEPPHSGRADVERPGHLSGPMARLAYANQRLPQIHQ